MRRKTLAISTVAALGIGGAVAWSGHSAPQVEAADHNDPPSVTTGDSTDRAADIADLYVFDRGENVVIALTFAGPSDPSAGQSGTFDSDVLYQLHITGGTENHRVRIRFGQNSSQNWGMEVTGFPGATGVLTGPVEFTNTATGAGGRYWAGLREDPFFFDLTGFLETAGTGTLSFDPTNDDFADKNVTAIVLEIPSSSIVSGGDTTFDVWASTRRIPAS